MCLIDALATLPEENTLTDIVLRADQNLLNYRVCWMRMGELLMQDCHAKHFRRLEVDLGLILVESCRMEAERNDTTEFFEGVMPQLHTSGRLLLVAPLKCIEEE